MKKILSTILCIAAAFFMCSCAPKKENFPVVTCDGNEIFVNGKAVAKADSPVYVNRIDSRVISLSVGSAVSEDGDVNIVNVDPDGNEIKLSDVITDRDLYESAIVDKLSKPVLVTRDSVYTGPEVDKEAMKDVLYSYDKTMMLPFYMGNKGVKIFYTEENGASCTISFAYDSGVIDSRFIPGDGVFCHSWMTGRVGYSISGMKLDGYSDHWAENSIEIENYNGSTYYWFCVAYIYDEDNRTYYSVIAKAADNGRKAVSIKQVDGPFVCCDLEEFGRMIDGR